LDYHAASLDAVFLFFEGLDDKKYYIPLVERQKNIQLVHSYLCDGKQYIVRVWKILRGWQILDMRRSLFFVDRDHDRYLGVRPFSRSNVFTTTTYSFENYLVSNDAVHVVLHQYTPLRTTERRFIDILDEFGRAHKNFVERMRPIMAWCIWARSEGKKPNMSNVDMGKVVTLAEGGNVRKRPEGFGEFRGACGVDGNVSHRGLKRFILRLKREPAKRWLRGKYELWFLQQFLNHSFEMLIRANGRSRGTRKILRPKALEGGDLVELLSGRVAYPEELIEFLKRHSLGSAQTHSPDSPVIAGPKPAMKASSCGCIRSEQPWLNLLNAPVH
jgi:hypothetical protein